MNAEEKKAISEIIKDFFIAIADKSWKEVKDAVKKLSEFEEGKK